MDLNGRVRFDGVWEVSFRSNYDLSNQEFAYTQIDFSRDLHCWVMTFNWVPFGPRQSFLFTLQVKSPVLSDLKLTKQENFQDRGSVFNSVGQ